MNFLKPKPQEQQPSPHLNLQQTFTNLQNHFFSLKPHLDSAFINLQNQARHALQSNFPPNSTKTLNQEPEISKTHKFSSDTAQIQNQESGFLKHSNSAITLDKEPGFSKPPNSPSNFAENPNQEPGFLRPEKFPFNCVRSPAWAQISANKNAPSLSIEEIEERLAGVPVYALSNPSEEFVLVSNVDSGKSIGLFCFKEEDAETLLAQMKSMDPGMRKGSKVVAVALNKVFQLKMDGVGFRLIPESSQIKNALNERRRAGLPDESFSGVPVFQSRSLILRSQNTRYRPVFFRKEDLDKSLSRASYDQKRMNPALREGDIQVAVLEDILLGMKDNSKSEWDDVVFIPPGFDVSTDPSKP